MAFPKIDGYVVTEKLGSGSYSTVYKAHTKVGGRSVVAIKCVDKSRVKHSGAAVDNLITEIRLLKTLVHPHIVHMKHFTWDDKNIYIIMEYCCGGDLSKYIRRYGRVPEKQVLYFLQQLVSALKFLREKGVAHMDLKPHNLLLQRDADTHYVLKVADFGFAQHMSEETRLQAVRGSPLYMAPEMMRGPYDARCDLWSVGVILYECLFGRAPYSSASLTQLVGKIHSQAPIEIPRSPAVSPGCADLLRRLLQHDPDARITYDELFRNEYLDLDHMPTKENYDKAVSDMKRAIELDAAGRRGAALRGYREALRTLVARAAIETDRMRRAALTHKLHRYMERAEEIKEYLKNIESGGHSPDPGGPPPAGRPPAPPGPPTPPTGPPTPPTPPPALQQATADISTGIVEYRGVTETESEQPPAASDARDRASPPPSPRAGRPPRPHPPAGSRLRRLFSRRHELPTLDSHTNEEPKKQRVDDDSNDACRIT